MRQPFEIVPRRGVGPVLLGAPREDVRATLSEIGFPLGTTNGSIDYFAENSLQVDFVDNRASFIGVAAGAPFDCTIDGVDPFDMPAEELFALLAKKDDAAHVYDEYEHFFPTRIVTLWDADPQYDRKRRAVEGARLRAIWGQLGIGDDAYARARQRRG
jgi:hypothetical protein